MSNLKALVPNLITAGNLLGGVLAIIFALTGHLEWAPYCIFTSAILDFLDGFAARLLKVQSELGKQLDSLADMVTFGVAPGIIVYQLLKVALLHESCDGLQSVWNSSSAEYLNPVYYEALLSDYLPGCAANGGWQMTYLPLIALIIPVMSMFRLAKFNLDARQSDSFIGLPTPANTLFFAALPLIIIQIVQSKAGWQAGLIESVLLNPLFLISSSVLLALMLVVELPLFSLKFKSFGIQGNLIRYIFLTLAALMLATLQWLALPLIIILYILLSIIQNLRKR